MRLFVIAFTGLAFGWIVWTGLVTGGLRASYRLLIARFTKRQRIPRARVVLP